MNRPNRSLPAEAARTLDAVLDCVIPPSDDGRLPGAGTLGLAAHVEAGFGDGVAALLPAFAALDARAVARGAAGFADLAPAQRMEVVATYADEDPGFLPGLIFHTYAGYYQNPVVQNALGMEGRPPHPKGYAIGADDPALLDPVRGRPALYRRP
jgi:hypothetical protein